MTSLRDNIRKYIRYIFNTRGFQPEPNGAGPDASLEQTALSIRDPQRPPAIIIHGIMPRAGTVYVGQLLRLHPDLYAFPHDWWEVPFLQMSGDILKLQEQFLVNHRHNRGKLSDTLFLTLFGSALMAHLHDGAPPGKRVLLKVPSVQYLHYFWTMFPHEHLLLLTRDGRDVVDSTVRTWPQIRFSFACRRWQRAAGMVHQFHQQHHDREHGYWLARFEDAVDDPESFVRCACQRFGLDVERYPFSEIANIRVRGSSRVTPQGDVDWQPHERPPDFQPTGHWRKWSDSKKRTFKRIAGERLEQLGYSTDQSW